MKSGFIFLAAAMPLAAAGVSAPAVIDSSVEQVQARAYLKERLQQLNKSHPFAEWEKRMRALRGDLEKFHARRIEGKGFDPALKPEFIRFSAAMDSVRGIRPKVEALIHEMYVEIMTQQVEALFARDGKALSPGGRETFYRALKPYEAGSLRPKTDYLAHLVNMDRKFSETFSGWLFAWAGAELPRRIEAQLHLTGIAAGEAERRDLTLKIDYWARLVDSDAVQAFRSLREIEEDRKRKAPRALAALEQLRGALQPDMLFSDLLEQAQREGLTFTVGAEERVEAALGTRKEALLRPVEEKTLAWKSLETRLRSELARAGAAEDRQQRLSQARTERERLERKRLDDQARERAEQERLDRERREAEARAREEQERQERARLEALAAEQRQAEEAQREQFHQTLDAWKSLQSGGLADLDSAAQGALATKAGRLKTSAAGTGRVHLRVETMKFSDTLAFVEKFTVAEGRIDLSKLSLDEKATQSAYVYASPSGRTSLRDLDQFVRNVSLGSFEAYYRFLSYLAPPHWRPGRAPAWKADRAPEAQVKDRTFSYVDLVVDAHRKRSGTSSSPAQRAEANVPANLIVIFDEQGGVRRYQSFADVREVIIRGNDLARGSLRYKFLNYSVDRQNIYLNGIDAEIKVSAPEG